MAQFASDTFTGADGTELSAYNPAWTNRLRNGAENCVLTDANRVRGPNNNNEYYHSGTPASADYSVSADCYIASFVSTISASVFARASTTVSYGYFATLYLGTGIRLYKQTSGGFSQLGTYAYTFTAGTTYNLKLSVSGSSPGSVVLKAYLDGAEVLSYTDSSSPHYAAGKAGIRFANLGVTSNNTTHIHIDNFSADDPSAWVDLTGVGNISSAEAVGSPAISTVAPTEITEVGGITSTESFGSPAVALGGFSPSIDSLATPIYIGHGGNKQMYPEQSHTGFNASVASGELFLDFDVWPLNGGSPMAVMHDDQVGRTTDGTDYIANKNVTQWHALHLDPTSGGWFGGGYPDTEAPPLLSEVLNNHVTNAVFSIECKPTTSSPMDVLLAELSTAGIGLNQALVSSFTASHMAQINAAGYKAMYLTGGSTPVATTQSYGVDWVGVPTAMSNALIGEYLAAGIKVVVWTINRRYLRDPYVAANPTITGFFSDDAKYLGSSTAIRTADNFASQTWDFGMYSADDLLTAASRGEFFAPDYWGYSSTEATIRGCLMGFLCPVADPTDFTLDLKITFDSADLGDNTKWASVFIGTTDQPYRNLASGHNGYHIQFAKDGSIAIYLKVAGLAPSLLNSVSGTTIADGEEKSFRITVTPTQIKAAQVSGGTDITANTVSNSSYRGGYISLSRNGLACKFRDLSINADAGWTATAVFTEEDDIISSTLFDLVVLAGSFTDEDDEVASRISTPARWTIASAISGTWTKQGSL
jgi:glycerophosphoryl diester phosphodiesterase